MKVLNCKDGKWVNAEHTMISCVVEFDELGAEHQFIASTNDPEKYGRDLFASLANGEFGPVLEYVAPISTEPSEGPNVIA